MAPAVFLDRDNTLIANDGDLGDPAAVRLLDGVSPGLLALREAGYRLVVVTNQGGVARGRYTEADVDAVHQRIAQLLGETASGEPLIERFYYCPFHPEGEVESYRREHPWRKPQPGMLLHAARDLGLDLGQSWMVGDQARDIAAGRSAGCRTVLLGNRADPAELNGARPTVQTMTFSEAVDAILQASPARPLRPADPPESSPAAPAPPAPTTAPSASAAASPADPTPGFPEADPVAKAIDRVRHTVIELGEDLRQERAHKRDFTPLRMAAVALQLLVLLVAMLGLLQVNSVDVFTKWMLGAILLQLATATVILLDGRG